MEKSVLDSFIDWCNTVFVTPSGADLSFGYLVVIILCLVGVFACLFIYFIYAAWVAGDIVQPHYSLFRKKMRAHGFKGRITYSMYKKFFYSTFKPNYDELWENTFLLWFHGADHYEKK